MKKFKIFGFIILVALFVLWLFGSCRKTKAMESELFYQQANISSRSEREAGVVFITSMGNNRTGGSSDFMMVYAGSTLLNLLNISNQTSSNHISIQTSAGTVIESYELHSRILQIEFVYDSVLSMVFMRIYELEYTTQEIQGEAPIIGGITRTLLSSFGLGTSAYDYYESPTGLTIAIGWPRGQGNPNWNSSLLLNYSYVSYLETSQDINNWVDLQLSNYLEYNTLMSSAYESGYNDGDAAGFARGRTTGDAEGYERGYNYGYGLGYNNGLNDGYDLGEQSTEAYQSGYDDGYLDGEQTQTAYQDGYRDGAAGETAISPVFRIISDVFGAIGAIMAVELVPHVPLGLFILVPLFFAALGLILWIWRRN